MKKQYILLLLLGFLSIKTSAQTLAVAKALYEKGEYAQAKTTFNKFVKTQPSNGNYNLWYGVCCLKTGEPEEALKYLEIAVKKRIPSGQFYLAQNYNALFRFEDAIQTCEEYITELNKRKRSTEEAEQLLEKSKNNLRMLKGVEQVCFVDSFVVDKKNFLEAYKISPESGQLFMYNTFFTDSDKQGGTLYQTELENKIYYSEKQNDGTFSILLRNKLLDKWSQGILLPSNINENVNAGYPYVLTDGVTIYYAADGSESLGGYDIFVTRYNTNTNSYLTPENVGMPFNSPYNDYMYVIDEFNNLGWFASDRYQPEDKVCIYVFVPNASKQVYNYENSDPKQLVRLAQLHSIAETWTDRTMVDTAKARLQNIQQAKPQTEKTYDFSFIIDDYTVYHHQNEFHSKQAQELFNKYSQQERNLKQQNNKLEEWRLSYIHSNETEKAKMIPAILDLEKRIRQLSNEMEQISIEIRKLEKSTIK